jgi:hypothetical protein
MPTQTNVLTRAMAAVFSMFAFCVSGCTADDVSQSIVTSVDGPEFLGPPPSLTVDRTTYVARGDSGVVRERQWRFTVITTLRNNADQVLYLETCGGPAPIYGLGSYAAQSAYEPMYACAGGGFGITVPPHAVRVDTIGIVGPSMFDGKTGAGFGALSGTIALSYTLATCAQVDVCRVGRVGATSDPFSVTAQP